MLMSYLSLRLIDSSFQKDKLVNTDCSCQLEGKLWLIEGAASTNQTKKNTSSCVLRLTPLTQSLEIKGVKHQEKMDDRVFSGAEP